MARQEPARSSRVLPAEAVPDGPVWLRVSPERLQELSQESFRLQLPGRESQPSSREPSAPEEECLLLVCCLVCFRYRLPNFPHSPARNGRERQRLGVLADGL